MANMQIYSINHLNTTTMLKPVPTQSSDWTETSGNIFDRKENNVIIEANGYTYPSLFITATSSFNINCIVIKNLTTTNLSQFRIRNYYGATTTHFSIVNCDTSSAHWVTNIPSGDLFLRLSSETTIDSYMLIVFAPLVTATACSIQMSDIYLLSLQHEFTDNPAVGDYKPKFDRTEYKHKMSDGGTATYVIQDNFSADVKLKYVSATDRNALKAIYQTQEPIVFIPFPTGTGWDGEIYEVNWVDDFDLGFTDNYTGNGYNIKMKLEETPK